MLTARRSFLAAPFLGAGLSAAIARGEALQTFRHERVLGTSMELSARGEGAARAQAAGLAEIERLCGVVSTYDPGSEISRWDGRGRCSRELAELMAAYAYWQERTGGVISARAPGGRLNVDALGKAFVMERALRAARAHAGSVLLNVGGDIAVSGGETWNLGVVNPSRPSENAEPLTVVAVRDVAIATSGWYERDAHLFDGRTGRAVRTDVSATVVARDAVTANALATALCVMDTRAGLELVARTPGAEGLVIQRDGFAERSAGFARYERPRVAAAATESAWPAGYDLTITLTLKPPAAGFGRRPYVAVWVEDARGKLVRTVALWASRPRWIRDLHAWWAQTSGNGIASMARATRPPGRYRLTWEGLDDQGRQLPAGVYGIFVESNREHGNEAKESAKIACGTKMPATASAPATSEFEAVALEYGPHGQNA